MLKGKITKAQYEALDENTKKFYKLEGDSAKLQVEGMEHDEDITGLRTALSKERETAEAATKTLKKYEKLGTIEELNSTLSEHKTLKSKTGDADKDLENLKTSLTTQHQTELAAKDQKISGLMGVVSSSLIDSVAATAISNQKGSTELLMPHIHKHTKVVETEGGGFTVHVLDKEGKRRFGKNGEGMKVEELVTEMKADKTFARAFDGTDSSGSGTHSDGAAGGGTQQRSKMTEEQKTAFISEKGLAAFQQLPK